MDRSTAAAAVRSGSNAGYALAGFNVLVGLVIMSGGEIGTMLGEALGTTAGWVFLETAFIAVLAFWVRKASRVAASVLFVYYVGNVLVVMQEAGALAVGAVALLFIYYFARAARGSFVLHEGEKAAAPAAVGAVQPGGLLDRREAAVAEPRAGAAAADAEPAIGAAAVEASTDPEAGHVGAAEAQPPATAASAPPPAGAPMRREGMAAGLVGAVALVVFVLGGFWALSGKASNELRMEAPMVAGEDLPERFREFLVGSGAVSPDDSILFVYRSGSLSYEKAGSVLTTTGVITYVDTGDEVLRAALAYHEIAEILVEDVGGPLTNGAATLHDGRGGGLSIAVSNQDEGFQHFMAEVERRHAAAGR